MSHHIALITGASRGLGQSIASHLAARGTHIIGTYHSQAEQAERVARDLTSHGVKAIMLPFDADALSQDEFVAQVARTLRDEFDGARLSSLVHNAGVGVYAPILESSPEQLDMLYRVHVRSPYLVTQSLLPHMRDGGRVLFVSSGLTRSTLPGYGAYAMMKGAVEVLTRYAAKEFGERGIRVNCLAPGAIETDFGGGAVRDNPQLNAMFASMTALGRAGLPEDIGGASAALLSEEMSWLNGERVEVSGGQSL